jgi:hypothetical protein
VSRATAAAAAVALASAVLAGALVACGVPNDGDPRGVASDDIPVGLLAPATTLPIHPPETGPPLFPTTVPSADQRIRVFLVLAAQDRVIEVDRAATVPVPADAPVLERCQAAADVLLQSPFVAERAGGLTTTLTSTTIRCLRVDEQGTLDVEVSELPRVVADQPLGMAQIVLTLTLVDDISGVRVRRDDGEFIRVPLWVGGEAEPGERVDRSDYVQAVGSFAPTDTTTTTAPTTTTLPATTAPTDVTAVDPTATAPPEQTPPTDQPAPPAEGEGAQG